jgi:hypothetical protein
MGILDDLKKELEKSTQIGVRPDEKAADTKPQEVDQELLVRIDDLYSYFEEFTKLVNSLDQKILVDYNLEHLGKLANLYQGEYKLYRNAMLDPGRGILQASEQTRSVGDHLVKIRLDDEDLVQQFVFSFSCRSDHPRSFVVRNLDVALAGQKYCQLHNVATKLDSRRDKVTITVTPLVHGYYFFRPDPQKKAISLNVRNMDGFGTMIYSYDPERIDSEFMDELGKYILRRPNRFRELSGFEMPEELRQKLREKLGRDPRGKEE